MYLSPFLIAHTRSVEGIESGLPIDVEGLAGLGL